MSVELDLVKKNIPHVFGSNLEQGCDGEFQIAHTVLDSWIRALVAGGGRLFPCVFQLVRTRIRICIIDGSNTPLPLPHLFK